MNYYVLLFVLLIPNTANSLEYGSKQEKTFKLIKEYSFSYRTYDEGIELPIIKKALSGNEGPDREIASIISALKKNDFNWWLSTVNKMNLTTNELDIEFNRQKVRYGNVKVYYFDWSIVGKYVFVGIKLSINNEEEVVDRLAFVLADGRWKYLPLKLENPILQGLNKEIEYESL